MEDEPPINRNKEETNYNIACMTHVFLTT